MVLIIFSIYFIICYMVFYIIYMVSKKRDTLGKNKAYKFIIKKYDLKMNQKKARKLSIILLFANTFILSLALTIATSITSNYVVTMIISILVISTLIISLYNIIGMILKKKGW